VGQKDKANVSQAAVVFVCAACSREDDAEDGDWLIAAVLRSKGIDDFHDPSEPDSPPIDDCPECGRASLVVAESELGRPAGELRCGAKRPFDLELHLAKEHMRRPVQGPFEGRRHFEVAVAVRHGLPSQVVDVVADRTRRW
jgi:hypothetical protein